MIGLPHTIRRRLPVISVLAVLVSVFLPGAPVDALAQTPELRLTLSATAPVGTDRAGAEVVAGLDAGASDAFDAALDVRAYRLGPLQAWFLDAGGPDGGRFLARDFREGAVETIFTLQLVTAMSPIGRVREGADVTLSWLPPETSTGVCLARSLTLVDGTASVEMALASEYTFPAPPLDTPYTLDLVVGIPGSATYAIPAAPTGLISPGQTRRGVLLVWPEGASDVAGYHVERVVNPLDGATRSVQRLTTTPTGLTRWLDSGVTGTDPVAYRLIAVSGAGCESAPSEELLVSPQ